MLRFGRRRLLRSGAMALAAAPWGAGRARAGDAAAAPFRVVLLRSGPAGGACGTDGVRAAVAAGFGDRVALDVSDDVRDDASCERALRAAAASGVDLVLVDDPARAAVTAAAARAFPTVLFEQRGGGRIAPNLGEYGFRRYEGCAVCGMLAGRISATGLCGVVAAASDDGAMLEIDAFTLAARKVNPDFRTRAVFLDAGANAGHAAAAAAGAMVSGGADLLVARGGGGLDEAVLGVARARGVHAFGGCAPADGALTAVVEAVAPLVASRIGSALAGRWKPEQNWWGFKQAAISLAPFGTAVTGPMRAAAEAIRAGIAAGALHPFEGPVRDASGRLRIADGARPDDASLRATDWPVEGVWL